MNIVVDTNIVFSALLNSDSRIGHLLLDSREKFDFFSCKYLQKEIYQHFEKLLKLTKLSDNELYELINIITGKIFFINELLLPVATIKKAKTLVTNLLTRMILLSSQPQNTLTHYFGLAIKF